jgi:hypothetical protein
MRVWDSKQVMCYFSQNIIEGSTHPLVYSLRDSERNEVKIYIFFREVLTLISVYRTVLNNLFSRQTHPTQISKNPTHDCFCHYIFPNNCFWFLNLNNPVSDSERITVINLLLEKLKLVSSYFHLPTTHKILSVFFKFFLVSVLPLYSWKSYSDHYCFFFFFFCKWLQNFSFNII